MLDMGFEKDIMKILHQSDIKKVRTNLLFSATMPNEIQQMAGSFLKNYVFLACGRVGGVGKLISQNVIFFV
jgi:superfamily II DNA/RNA helicase